MSAATNANRPTIVCLVGSTRFYRHFQRANHRETLDGKIVLSIGYYEAGATETYTAESGGSSLLQKVELDALHLKKIDLADEVLVLNLKGYVGESTAREIAYAIASGKRIRYLEDCGIADLDVQARISGMVEDFEKQRMITKMHASSTYGKEAPTTNASYLDAPLPPLMDDHAPPPSVGDARRVYDLYLRAFAAARAGGQFDLDVTDEEEKELGADLVLMHRRAVLAGVIDGASRGTLAVTTELEAKTISTPRSPAELWSFVNAAECRDWSFLERPST